MQLISTIRVYDFHPSPHLFSRLPALCVMIAASIYTAENKSFHKHDLQEGSFGSSYVVAWISFPMTLISGLMYLVLRKRK